MRRATAVAAALAVGVSLSPAAPPAAAGPSPRNLPGASHGGGAANLVYTPIVPCRILDTRTAEAGSLTAFEQRGILVRGGEGGYGAQGGAADCGIPGLDGTPGALSNLARAVTINLVAVGPTAAGHLTAWPVGAVQPTASSINYSSTAANGGLNVANGVVLGLCEETGATPCEVGGEAADLLVQAITPIDLVADVTGYFHEMADSGPVTSVFGRSGDVVAAAGDYLASQVTNVPAGTIAASTVQAAIDELEAEKASVAYVDAAADQTIAQVLAEGNDAAGADLLGVDQLGLGTTSVPAANLRLQIRHGNTPGLRLEQTNEQFAAQTWDVAANEVSFFVRDVTSGSRLGFRIGPGAPTNSLVVDGAGRVGLAPGTGSGMPTLTTALDVFGDAVRVRTSRTPASATAACNAGEIVWDAGFVYVCVATDTWKRAALTTW